ncbi:MAG TPA: DUF4276 family protein [Pirellulales bacterium]
MSKVIAVVEGSTEQTFVREVLAPWLWNGSQVELVASPAGKPGKNGGNSYARVRRDIINHLRNPHFTGVTTFFDFYGMPLSWPGRTDARTKSHASKPSIVENAIRNDITADAGEDLTSRLYPYVQMYEFEALLFSDTTALPEVMRNASSKQRLDAIREDFGTPEEINDSPNTAPSKRIEHIFPFFRKPLHGVLAAKRITIEVMLGACPHFEQWVALLGSLGGQEGK